MSGAAYPVAAKSLGVALLGPLRKRAAILVGFVVFSAAVGVVRFHNLTDVLVAGRIYFVDADCYSRMSRAKMVSEAPGTVVGRQMFENWPEGVMSHATSPMDYTIFGLERLIRFCWPEQGQLAVLRASTLDLAGALVSPLLGVLLCAFIGFWAYGLQDGSGRRLKLWWCVPVLAALSPPLVHATLLGRPDHQSLLLLCLTVAMGAEQRLQMRMSSGWGWAGGLAWGGALWVSFYEPLILLSCSLVLSLCFWPATWSIGVRGRWCAGILLPLVTGVLVDHIRIVLPDPRSVEFLKRWGATIGELQPLSGLWELSPWTGLLLWVSPLTVFFSQPHERRGNLGWMLLLLFSGLLANWQIRWSPYFVLVFLCALPRVLALAPGLLSGGLAFVLGLWPLLADWENRIFPEARILEQRYMDRSERINARLAAERMKSAFCEPFIAVWWLSPSLSYWSGQPAVSGSGHEGIEGIMDSARFFMSTDPAGAREIIDRRGVRFVVASDSARAVENSAAILGSVPESKPLAERLWQPAPGEAWELIGEANVTTFRLLRPVLKPDR